MNSEQEDNFGRPPYSWQTTGEEKPLNIPQPESTPEPTPEPTLSKDDMVKELVEFVDMIADDANWYRNGGSCRWLDGNAKILKFAKELIKRHNL